MTEGSAEENDRWQAQVCRFLKSGYGIEDIAVLMACPIGDVRAEIDILRENGKLTEIFEK